jgi:predicted dehydrogenase
VVGAGAVAEVHMRAWARVPGVRIASVVDLDAQRARVLADRYHVVSSSTSIDEALTLNPDFVDVCTPPGAHEEAVRAAAAVGAAVLVEKPMADTPASARAIQRVAEEQGVLVVPVHQVNHIAVMRRLRRAVSTGRAGDVAAVTVHWHNTPDDSFTRDPDGWVHQYPGGRLFEALPHPMYILHGLIGPFEVTGVSDAHVSIPWMETDNLAVVVRGARAIGLVSIGTTAARTVSSVTLVGSRLNLVADLTSHTLVVQRGGERGGRTVNTEAVAHTAAEIAQLASDTVLNALSVARRAWRTGHDVVLAGFAETLRTGAEPPATVAEGVAAIEATHRALELLKALPGRGDGDQATS